MADRFSQWFQAAQQSRQTGKPIVAPRKEATLDQVQAMYRAGMMGKPKMQVYREMGLSRFENSGGDIGVLLEAYERGAQAMRR